MNKRQAKKQYKKIHGYNPVSTKQRKAAEREIYIQYNLTPEQTKYMVEVGKRAAIMADILADAADTISNAFRTAAKKYKGKRLKHEYNSSSNYGNYLPYACIH